MTASTAGTGSRRVRRRHRRRRAVVLGVLAVAVAASTAGVVWVVRDGDRDPTAALRTESSAGTAPPTTTTTLVTGPEMIEPPRSPEAAAATLERVERGLRADPRDPAQLRVLGWEQQMAYRQLSNHPDWVEPVVAALPPDVAPWVQANLEAGAALSSLTPPQAGLPDWTILVPEPPEALRGYYAEAEAQSGIPWAYLAAIHFLETRMGRIHGNSPAGAQGPMQFIPSSWAAHGAGGDVHDDRDAILAAGRYLQAAGGPADMERAIFAYNHDDGYVAAVQAYARNLLEDPRAYDGYYQWQVLYRTVDGAVLLPEGYAPGATIGPRALPPT